MSAKKTGLGTNKGLGKRLQALGLTEQHVDDVKAKPQGAVEIPVAAIVPNPHQPRRYFDPAALETLAKSIQEYGIVQPLVVQQLSKGKYELVAGERRLRAAQLCHLSNVPAIIKSYEPQVATEIALIENLQREDLNAIEEGQAYAKLIEEFGLTQEEASKKVGKSRSHVANMMRLLQLPEAIQQAIQDGQLSMGQARPLLQLPTDLQLTAAEKIISQGLSARQAEQLVKTLLADKPQPAKEAPDAYLESVQDKMKMHLGTSVAIRLGKNKKKGKIEISFTSEAEFERLLALLTDEDERRHGDDISSFHV